MHICKTLFPMALHSIKLMHVVILLVWSGLATNSKSQQPSNAFIKKVNSDNGLSHNVVNDIVQDGKGFIWIATQYGLNRYDSFR